MNLTDGGDLVSSKGGERERERERRGKRVSCVKQCDDVGRYYFQTSKTFL